MRNIIEISYKKIKNYRLPSFDKTKKDFIFFTTITQQPNIICFISLENPINNDNVIYQKFIDLSQEEYQGFITQLDLLNINNSFNKKFYINYTLNTLIPNQSYLSHKTTYLISSMLLIENSRKFLSVFNHNYFKYNKQTMGIFRYFSCLVLNSIDIGDIVNINIVSSFVLFLYNIRNINDLDLNIKYGSQKNFKTTKFKDKINIIKEKLKKKYNFELDILYSVEDGSKNIINPNLKQFIKWYGKKGKYYYNKYINNYTLKKFNAKYESEISYDPSNYFYILGLKCSSLEYEFYRRYESLTQQNVRHYCHAKRLAEIVYLINNKFIKSEIPFYTTQFNEKCFNETQKYYYIFFKKHINIKSIKNICNKIKGSKYIITLSNGLLKPRSNKKTKKKRKYQNKPRTQKI